MADLRSRFLEDYAGGILNVSRQELASNGEVLSQDGFLIDSTVFVEDGVGTKSGLRLGVGLAEVVDPTTQTGAVNVRFADRTYTKIRDTKIFTTAMASAQAALAESVTEAVTNIESAIDFIELNSTQTDSRVSSLEASYSTIAQELETQKISLDDLAARIKEDIAQAQTGSEEYTNNIKIGLGALGKLTNGAANTAVGVYSLGEMLSGNDNLALGSHAGINLVRGNNNVVIGNDARLSKPNTSNELVLGNFSHDFLWAKTDIYSPATRLSTNDTILNSEISSDFFKFVKSLRFRKIKWDKGQTSVVIDPASLRRAEETLGLKGYVHSDSSAVSNAKLVPILLQTLSGLFDLLGLNVITSPGSTIGGGGTGTDGSGTSPVISGANGVDGANGFDGADGANGLNGLDGAGLSDADRAAFAEEDANPVEITDKDPCEIADPIETFQRNFFPIGGIIMWSNYADVEMPSGWQLCNGLNGTPDLRNKFIVGAGAKFEVSAHKDTGPTVPTHKHEGIAEWKVVIEQVAIPAPQEGAFPTGLHYGSSTSNAQVDPMDTQGELSEANVSANLNMNSAGVDPAHEEIGHETYPPYYALAYIMRIA